MELFKTWLFLAFVAGSYAAPFSTLGRQCSRQTCDIQQGRYEVGKKYTYHYNAKSESWINGTSEQKSSLQFDCQAEIDVLSPCELALSLKDVSVYETNANGEHVTATDEVALRNELQDHILRFAFIDGTVTDVCPVTEEKTWALNFKRGFLSAIQAPVTEVLQDAPVTTTETDVTGKCPVLLKASEYPGSIKKFKDFNKCEQHVKIEGGIRATVLKPEAPTFNILECLQECEVSFESNIVSESVCNERHLSKAFSKQRSGAVTLTKVIVDELVVSQATAPANPFLERRTTILFDHEESKTSTEEEVMMKAKEILRSISRKLNQRVGLEMPNLFSDLVTEMRKIETTAAMTSLKQFAEEESKSLFNVFKDALPMCETVPSVETMVTIINEIEASTDEEAKKAFQATRAMWLTFPSVISHPKKEMISALMPLIKTLSVEDTVFFLPTSSLINRYCTSENPSCLDETEVRQALEYFQQLLGFDCTPTAQVPTLKMLMALKALTNVRLLSTDSKISTINKCFDHHDPAKGMEIKVAALELVRRLPCKPVYQTYAKAMYRNNNFDSELRIAAYRALMTCPSNDIMSTIQQVMSDEQSDQVASYVWTHLANLNKTSDPQKQHLKKWVQDSGIIEPIGKTDLRKFSRNMELSWYNDEMASGLTIDSDMIFSSKSFLPREFKLNSTIQAFGYAINLFEIGGRLEGMHQIMESYLGPRGYLAENSVQALLEKYQQDQQQAFLDNLPDAGEVTLPEGLPEGVTLEMYTQLLRMLQFQQKMFGGKIPLPIPGEPMPKSMPKGMTQEMYDELLVIFMRDGVPGLRKKRHLIKESSINDIESKFHAIDVEDKPHASAYFKTFGSELAYLDIAKIRSRLVEMQSSMNPMKMLMNMAKDQTHELTTNAIVMDESWTLPMLSGLPLKIAVNGTMSMKVRTEGKIDMRGILMSPRSFEINGVIEPSAALEVSTSMEVMARQTRSGLNQVSRLHSSLSLGGKIQVTNGKAFIAQINIPDERQEIIDVSSNIYLRVQDASPEIEGIPERLEKSYCSGTHTTKYIGGQFCTEISFPKSFSKDEYPLFPLTGPSKMLVTLEKTDPSLTSWKLEGSYGLEKETVEDELVKTDVFHFMFGTPDTSVSRTFQLDVTYNRNKKEMNLNVITPVKTVDIHSKVTNNEFLRKLELSATLDKTHVYTLDTEVESRPSVVDGDPVITFYPRMDITSPKGLVVKYRSSIGVRDGQQTRVNMWMSLDSPRTSLVTVSGDVVKTESTRKVRYSSDLQISGRYVNVNVSSAWQKQKRDNIITLDATVLRRVSGEIVKDVVISAKYTNRTTEGRSEWDMKTEWAFKRYPLLSFMFETDYTGTPGSSESTSKLCYRYDGQECGQNTKVIMGHQLQWESSESTTSENFNFKIRNPANNIHLEVQQHVIVNSSHPIAFSFTVVNNTSEMEVINAAVRTRILGEEPIKGDFEASLRSETWRYAALQDWEFSENKKAVLNTGIHWNDQRATLGINLTPTEDETGLMRYDFNTLLTYPLGSFSTSWYAWKKDKSMSHGASAFLIDQQLFAYKVDFINKTIERSDLNLIASFNISRPMSPVSVMLHASNKGKDIDMGCNVTLGDVKAFTSGFNYMLEPMQDNMYDPKHNFNLFFDVEIPQRDFSLSYKEHTTMTTTTSEDEITVILRGKTIYYKKMFSSFGYNPETGRLDHIYDYINNMSSPFPDYDYRMVVNITDGNHNHKLVIYRNKVEVFFLAGSYNREMLEADMEEQTNRHAVKIFLNTPLVILKDISWNSTLDIKPRSFNFDTRLLYFPSQEHPFIMTINYQNKSSNLVTHNQLNTTFETVKRRINIFNMAKFDLGSGIVIGSSSVEVGVLGSDPEKFDMTVEYNNKTEGELITKQLVLTFNSPDNTIKTDGVLSYTEETRYTTTFNMFVSERSIFEINVDVRNDSDVSQKTFDVDSTFRMFQEQLRIHMVHNQDANSFHPNVKIHLANERHPTVETDVLYTKTGQLDKVHTVVVTLMSKDMEPFKIQTTYTNGSNSQNVSVVISTSPDKHLDMKFDVATNVELKTCDVRFLVDNTYLPNRTFEVTAQYGNTDNQLNLNSVLKISDVQMMNIVYVVEHTSSEQQMRRATGLTVTFPQMVADYPALSKLALRRTTDVQDGVEEMQKAEMRWGQLTDDEAVILQLTIRNNWWQVQVNHPMELEPLPKEITIVLRNDTVPTAILSFEMRFDGDNVNLMSLTGSYSPDPEDERVRQAMLTLTRPDQPDIVIKLLQAELQNKNVVFGSEFRLMYSEDENRHMRAMVKVLNNTNEDLTEYDINFTLLHPVSNLDIETALTFMNNNKKISGGLEGMFSGETTKPFNFEFTWNKEELKYTFLSNTPMRKMLFTGQFEDRSYSDIQIYRFTMTNTYNDDRIIRSIFEFNSQLEQISYIVHHDPDMPDDYIQFRAGFLNETALVSLVESVINGKYSVDARLLLALETPKILMTHLKWNPYWVDYFTTKMQQVQERMNEHTENLRGEVTASHQSLRERLQISWYDFLLNYANIKNTLDDMYSRFKVKYQTRKEHLQQLQEAMKTRSTNYWNELKEELMPHQQNILNRMEDMKTKYDTWAAEVDVPAQEYYETMTQRVKDFYKKHIKPLFEELEDLFENLKLQHEIQWDILVLNMSPALGDFQIPMVEPKNNLYAVGGSQDVEGADPNPAEAIVETSINVPGEKKISFSPEETASIFRIQRFQMMKIWQEIAKLWNETKAEFEAILAEIDAEFKQSNFYLDLTEKMEELKLRFPVEQWRQEVEAKIEEIKQSDEIQELKSLLELIKEELLVASNVTRNVTKAGLIRIRDRIAEALEGYGLNILEYLKRPTYELVINDLENGEILVRLHLPGEINSLKRMPESFYQLEMVRSLQKLMAEVRERSRNTLGEITMSDGTVRSMYELILNEPMLLYREGNISEWFQGERIKTMRKFWEYYHLSRLYLNPVNWIPPHQANAMIVGANHYMTFDHTFYDFSGGCSYLLAHDFIDGNFTVIVEYNRENNVERQKTIVLYLNSTTIFEIRSDSRVYHGKQMLELPLQYGNTTIMHHMNSIRIHNTNGVTITCDIAHDICNVNVSGWYFGKTAGLFGTYNYETKDDFTTSDSDMARHVDDFTRSWKVGKRCSGSSTDALPECNTDPEVEANLICSDNFLKPVSSLTECLGVVDPAPYYSMCTSKMCQLTVEQHQKEACQSIKAYVNECNRMNVNIGMPDFCVVCKSHNGTFTKGKTISLQDEDVVPKSADVVVIVEEKLCNANMRESISDIIDMYDTDLKNSQGFSDMRYGLLGFGGEGVHDLPHIHTIDGKVFNTKRALTLQGLPELQFAEDGSNDTFAAILAAANYPFRAGVAKNIILLSCTGCQRLYHLEKTYSDVASVLMRQGIQFNILMNSQLELVPTRAKNTSPKNQFIYGIDNRTVFTNKALSSGSLIGDKTLRKLVNEPINQCALLAFESGGSLFDTAKIQQKKFMDVFTQRMIQGTVIEKCQVCTCKADSDWVGRAVCEPCHIAREYPWMFEMERTLAEAYYYSQRGMQSFMDYMNAPVAIDSPVNKTPKKA